MSDHPALRVLERRERLVAGVMTGTSVDGVDVALVRMSGSGRELRFDAVHSSSIPIPAEIRSLVEAEMDPETSSVRQIALLNVRLARLYEDAIREAVDKAGLSVSDLDAIGLHGQTIYHLPDPVDVAGLAVAATLQVGDPSTLANLLGVPVVGDFRQADMALGGQGAPLVPYFDFVALRDREEGRIALNIGGIANITVLPADCVLSDVRAFDTGPGNCVIDALARRLLSAPFDDGGQAARSGTISESLLADLLAEPWFSRPPPKSTGRELFSNAYAGRLIERGKALGLADEDIIATATALTVRSIHDAYERFVASDVSAGRVIVSGGGVHNAALMDGLARGFGEIPVETARLHGVDPDAKEAICFAVLAHATLNGIPSNVPSATGASRPAILGKICLP